MSNIERVIQRQTPGCPPEVETVRRFIQSEFDSRSLSLSCSDVTDQSNRIDYLEEMMARLVDALVQVQPNLIPADEILSAVTEGYRGIPQLKLVTREVPDDDHG